MSHVNLYFIRIISMKPKFEIGQIVMKDNVLCKITRAIQYFEKGSCIGYEYYYLPFGSTRPRISTGKDLVDLTTPVRIERTWLSTSSDLIT
jgi:hypothetical protein